MPPLASIAAIGRLGRFTQRANPQRARPDIGYAARSSNTTAAEKGPSVRQINRFAAKVPGLYAIGEAVDVTGWLGGYNFQWAWASGFACAEALAQSRTAQ